jgi:hypothetical protein
MAYATAVTTPIASVLSGGFTADPCGEKRGPWWDVKVRPDQDICLEEGEFMLKGPRGLRRIARFTGRDRWITSTFRAPTLEVFDVDTVVEMVGDLPVIVGRRGEKVKGTWYTSPKAKAV